MKVLPSQLPIRRRQKGGRDRVNRLANQAQDRMADLVSTARDMTRRKKDRQRRRNLLIVAVAASVAASAMVSLAAMRLIRRRRTAGLDEDAELDRARPDRQPQDGETDPHARRAVDVASAR